KVTGICQSEMGEHYFKLSRKAAQIECQKQYISKMKQGDIIEARISHMEKFGSFVDIGCGIPSLVPIDTMSVSRISHPTDRFRTGQLIRVIVKGTENGMIFLTHKELLGTWEENACRFKIGETVPGVVRSIESYGVFVELTPNLAGLAESKEGISVGQSVSVYIKAIIPEKMKVKLIIVDVCGEYTPPKEIEYFIKSDHINYWKYSTDTSEKNISTSF
ncbi:MAG: 30S ribosomal protein S1, partial [Ruminococcus sp.]|nr:30S ribosomal protein S1 [Ruminococcus sp.]